MHVVYDIDLISGKEVIVAEGMKDRYMRRAL